MLTGIELMLKRMETHPEEFVGVQGGCSKEWYAIFSPVIQHLTEEELNAVNTALKKAYREHFTGQVMKQMAGESVMSDRERQYAEDYYGRSLTEMLRKVGEVQAETLGATAMRNQIMPLKAIKPYQVTTAGSNGTTAPSAFGAVPVSSASTVTISGSSS